MIELLIKHVEKIKYNSVFNLHFYYLVKNNIYRSNDITSNILILKYDKLYISINNDFVEDIDYTDMEKVHILLKNIVNLLTNDEIVRTNLYNILEIKDIDCKYKFSYFNFYSGYKIILFKNNQYYINFYQKIDLFEYINVNNLSLNVFKYIDNLRIFSNITSFDNVIEKENYNKNDYLLFSKLYKFMESHNMEYAYKNILEKYLSYILKNCKLDIKTYINMNIYEINDFEIKEKIIKSLSNKQLSLLMDKKNINNIELLKNCNDNIKKKFLLRDDISFQDKIKLTSYLKENAT